MTSIGLGCGRPGCTCEYCNGDNYDRYIGDHLRNILDELNTYLHPPVSIDDDKIKSVANRMIFFDPTKPHASTNTTNKDRRVNINFNYF